MKFKIKRFSNWLISSRVNKPLRTISQKMQVRSRTRLTSKMVIIIASSCLCFFISLFFIFYIIETKNVSAVSLGDYRSKATGNWSTTSTWEYYNGTSWVAATGTPTSTDGIITIQSGHTVTVTVNVTVDQVIVDPGGGLTVFSGKNLTIANGTGDDLTVNGTVTINGTLTNQASTNMEVGGLAILKNGGANNYAGNATININNGGRYRAEDASMTVSANHWIVKSGGVYQHNLNGAALPVANWMPGSTCEVTGVVSTQPSGLTQPFENFTWNCSSQTSIENLQGKLTTINGDFTFVSTGTGSVRLSQPENYTLAIGGNFNFQGGNLFATTKSNSCLISVNGNYVHTGGTFAGTDDIQNNGQGSPTITINGNFNISAGTIDLNQYTGSNASKGLTTFNISGDFTQTGGTITETASQTGTGIFIFKKSGTQLFSKTGGTITNDVDFKINSASVLDVGTSIITGGGDFTLSSGGGLNIGSANGIASSGATGNIQVTGLRSFNTGAYYTYNGNVAQITGSGLPSTINKLTINNSNDVTLTNTTSISNILTFSLGNVVATSDTLVLGISTASIGTLSYSSGQVVGNFKRWFTTSTVSNILFPIGVGGYYEGVNLSYTVAPTTGGTISATYNASNPGKNGFNLYESPDSIINIGFALWTTTPGNGFSGGTFNIDITATSLPNVTDYSSLHLLRRANSGSAWALSGVHSAGTGSNSIPVVHRTGLTSHGQFGIGSSATNSLPVELIYFKAKLDENIVKLSWATASELNNDYFTIERSSDGIHFEEILRQKGAGNNTFTLYYSAEDVNPLNGYNYYRLKQTDYDGHFTYSDVETIKFKVKAEEEPDLKIISVAPNPFSENFNINFTSKKAMEIDIMLINSNGQMVAKNKIQTTEGFNTYEFTDNYNLNIGVYFLYIVYDGQKITQKIIKY